MVKTMKARIKFWLKIFLGLPIYRVDVLVYVLNKNIKSKHPDDGLCWALHSALDCIKDNMHIKKVFPLFSPKTAKQFEANIPINSYENYWWPPEDWKGPRKDYLLWLIDQYKDDKENIRKFQVSKHI